MQYEKRKFTLTNLCVNLKTDAKVRRFLAHSKYLGQIFSELLRRYGESATKGLISIKYCRKHRKFGGFSFFSYLCTQKIIVVIPTAILSESK